MLKNTILALSALFFVASTPALADPQMMDAKPKAECGCKKKMCSGDMKKHQNKMMKKLNLSSEQQEKMQQIRKQYKDKMMQGWKMQRDLRQQIMKLAMDKEVDTEKLDNLTKQRADLSIKLMKERVMMRHDMYQVLTDAQREQLKNMKQRFMNKKMQAS